MIKWKTYKWFLKMNLRLISFTIISISVLKNCISVYSSCTWNDIKLEMFCEITLIDFRKYRRPLVNNFLYMACVSSCFRLRVTLMIWFVHYWFNHFYQWYPIVWNEYNFCPKNDNRNSPKIHWFTDDTLYDKNHVQ